MECPQTLDEQELLERSALISTAAITLMAACFDIVGINTDSVKAHAIGESLYIGSYIMTGLSGLVRAFSAFHDA